MSSRTPKSPGERATNCTLKQPKLEGRELVTHHNNLTVKTSQPQPKDHWTHSAYNASAFFVPLLTTEILQWLNPSPHDKILDIGCGDGVLTAKIAHTCASIDGFDSSSNLIRSARESYNTVANVGWYVVDCRYLEKAGEIAEGRYDKVFSNAAFHWILRDPSTRLSVLRGARKALKPGGEFVFEMGGAGNVADVHTALLAALVHQGIGIEKARDTSPWFFPSEQLMKTMLEEVGFQVDKSKLEYRPTKVTLDNGGGLEGWVRLMGAQFLEVLPTEEKKEAVMKEVCEVLKTVLMHEEDGSMWLGYVRLKIAAHK